MFIIVSVYFVVSQSGNFWIHPITCKIYRRAVRLRTLKWNLYIKARNVPFTFEILPKDLYKTTASWNWMALPQDNW